MTSQPQQQQLTMDDMFHMTSQAVRDKDPPPPASKRGKTPPPPPEPTYYPIPPPPPEKEKRGPGRPRKDSSGSAPTTPKRPSSAEEKKEAPTIDPEDIKRSHKRATCIRQINKLVTLIPAGCHVDLPHSLLSCKDEQLADLKKILFQTILQGYEETIVKKVYFQALGWTENICRLLVPFFPRNPILRRIAILEPGTISAAMQSTDLEEIHRDLEIIAVMLYDIFPSNPFLKLAIDTVLALSALSDADIRAALREGTAPLQKSQEPIIVTDDEFNRMVLGLPPQQ